MNISVDISKVIIKTKRLTLRPFKEEDLNDFYEYASVDGVGEMAGWTHHQSIEESKKILDMFIAEKKNFALVYNNKVIGSLGIEKYNEKEFPEFNFYQGREIGYVLNKDYWGHGLMPEALEAVIDYLFNEVKLDFLVCEHFTYNNQSKRAMEKVGFKHYKIVDYLTKNDQIIKAWASLLQNPRIPNVLVNNENVLIEE